MAHFIDLLPPEVQAHLERCREYGATQRQTMAGLNDASLAATAKYWMQHCRRPKELDPEAPTYDSTFWHAIVPELIKRLEGK